MNQTSELWQFFPWGYALTVLLEMPILLIGLSPAHAWNRKIFAGFWLTAATYPIVVLVLPLLLREFAGEAGYLAVAETFAPLAECLLFWLAFDRRGTLNHNQSALPDVVRDMAAIVLANLFSFLAGIWLLTILWPAKN